MAKKTPVKKSKRRLKRTVRKSLAAVLMITAIVIAAIPVPENRAEDGSSEYGISTMAQTEVHSEFTYDATGQTGTTGAGINLSKYEGKTIEEIAQGADVYSSLMINDLGGGTWDLGWQFMFYLAKNPKSGETQGVIAKYNSQYRAETVNLELTPYTEYYTVEKTRFDAYFAGTTGQNMDNNPTDKVSYRYSEWDLNSLDKAVLEAIAFFQTYRSDDYNAKIAEFESYKKALAAYDALPDDQKASTQAPVVPADLEAVPADVLTETQKYSYFCEHDKILKSEGEGYSLVSVIDSRIDAAQTGGNSSYVYVAQGGTPLGDNINDDNGFLVTSQGRKICAIGAGAFKGVGNVDVLTIPSQIGYIGDEAFANSFIKEIDIVSVESIGNKAFKQCTQLSKVTINPGTTEIGVECFEGSAITSLTLPYTISNIYYGAFANCQKLTTLNLNGITNACTVDDAAFYECSALATISMDEANIVSLGDGAFAVASGSVPMGIVMPKAMSASDSVGDHLFAGRAGLQYVVFPANIGRSNATKITLPDNMFHGCTNLQYVQFPSDIKSDPYACGFVTYKPAVLFADVVYNDFYVRGPETNNTGDAALPRQATWEAVTAVNDFVPYVFTNSQGVDCYEVTMDGYRYQANAQGQLTSCVLVGSTDGNLVIPAKVGNYKITSIVDGCFDDEDLRNSIKTITIQDNSITTIADSVFKDLPKLTKVTIGNSVTSIGASAFEGCNNLIDVTFNTPTSGYDNFVIGSKAFETGSTQLTFHGDIVEGYAPFEWAMEPDNVIDTTLGTRVCYTSLGPSYLTVMYGVNDASDSTGYVTLLDYPKFDTIDVDHADHNAEMEEYYYEKYAVSDYDSKRTAFRTAWEAATDKDEVYASDNYGPWVNPYFCTNYSTGSDTGTATVTVKEDTQQKSSLLAWLTEPLVVQAADTPTPYYSNSDYAYSILKNYLTPGTAEYLGNTPEEAAWVNATTNVTVPAGVESIDVYGYIKNNTRNAAIYLKGNILTADEYKMYTDASIAEADDPTTLVPGLFSGYYVDKQGTSTDVTEEWKRGNDRIKSITLNTVKFLPDNAFDSCEALQTVTLGADCSDIGKAPFRGCKAVETVNGNDYYEIENGIVYSVNTDGSYTIEECIPSRGLLTQQVGSAQISESADAKLAQVSKIREGAFEDCDDISLVDLSSATSLAEIPEDCFKDSKGLQRIYLPATVNKISSGAFADCTSLSELRIPGEEVFISGDAFVENPAKATTTVRTSKDSSAKRYVDDYGTKYKLEFEEADYWKVIFLDVDLNQVGDTQSIEDGGYAKDPGAPAKTGWVFEKWLGTNNAELTNPITEDTTFIATGYYTNGMVDGKYSVAFYDQIDGSQIGTTQYVASGGAAIAPQAPTHTGYTFDKWSSTGYENVTSNLVIMAMYKSTTGTTSGSSTNTSGGSTSSGSSNNGSSGSTTTTSTSTSSTSTTSTSTSGTSTTSGSTSTNSLYTVTVENGSGSGSYAAGSTVVIAANTPAAGMVFSKWTTQSNGVTLASVSLPATTFVMPANNVTVTANYVAGNGNTAANGNGNGNGTNNGTNGNGNTTVDITKPGISNKDLATANVNGSSDNFIVKISETDEATQAVAAALTNKYGSLDNILYYAMDISLYDSTGTTKITDTTGLSVDITIPIPDALVAYGGNNMAGAVINNNQLEDLSERFTTINGVPCISFTATHFSPYTIYVDTSNLTEGTLDVTPKTGDPIHPKWFLSIGLACLSVILFLKRDKVSGKRGKLA